LLVDAVIGASPATGVTMVLVAAVNGIAVVRVYFLLFTGGRHVSSVSLAITPRERLAVLTLTALILGGGLAPQEGVAASYKAADALLKDRATHRQDAAEPEIRSSALPSH
jgi:NADH-quinone oxidoreductase subunit M